MPRPRRYHHSRPPQDTNSPVKLLFGLYQCLHHLSFLNSDGRSERSRPFSQKVDKLDRFFIPALPTMNSDFKKRCHETNEKWRQDQMKNLTDHYNWCTDALLGSISACLLTKSDMMNYLNQTRKWAKQHFKRKFKNHLFEKVDKIVQNFVISEITAKEPVPCSSNKIRSVAATEPVVKSTPKRKRGPPSSPEASPVDTHTPKRPRPSTYAEKIKSPPAKTKLFAKTQKSSPSVIKFGPFKKVNKDTRFHEVWQIPKLTKDILVLGDSNLARISFVKRRDAHVISYSGLKFDSLLKLLQNFQHGSKSSNPGVQPSQVIFAVGINDRGLSDSTNAVNLKKVFNEAKRQFPNSKISFYSTPFDNRLKPECKKTIENLNKAIEELCGKEKLNCIPKVPRARFNTSSTDNSHIHWTEDCANATIEHILNHLN